ncbi:hypothetical protein AVEN_141685-1 [Araneus ventricosus]|uniref:Uncharacterized protein n=1 Tax=Araneus ventricosus TaxID=182803 RepID=A0A4Y2JL35_ARAVE|nr:hypothetical protein AVEN_141685-1 [Araneus ventricosus]
METGHGKYVLSLEGETQPHHYCIPRRSENLITYPAASHPCTRVDPRKRNALGNQSIGHYLYVHKDSFSNPPTNRRLEEAVVVDWPKMMKFKAS